MSNWWKNLALASRVRATAHADDPHAIAIQRAANETATYVGVALARETMGNRESLTWHTFPMASAEQLAEWYADWVGTPALYLYLAAFDKSSEAWARGNANVTATPDGAGGRQEIIGAADRAYGAMTLTELTHAMHDQDFRWAGIVDKARRAKHPIAPVAARFFKINWEPVMRQYMLRIGSLNPALAARAIDEVLAHMHELYGMARAIGFPESSFLLPDIDLDDPDDSHLAAQGQYHHDAI